MEMLVLLAISMLATWRATYMLQEEKGPFGIFSRLQAWTWTDPWKEGGLKDGLRCFYCTSVWVSFIPALMIEHHDIGKFFIYWLGIAAGAVLINLFHARLEQ